MARAAVGAGCDFFACDSRLLDGGCFQAVAQAVSEAGGRICRSAGSAEAGSEGLRAAEAGAVAMVGSGGPTLGGSAEAVGRAQIGEIPLVMVHCQWLGPPLVASPMAVEGDVILAGHLGVGSLPLPVLAVSDLASVDRLTRESFRLARALRTPVILLTSLRLIGEAGAREVQSPPPAGDTAVGTKAADPLDTAAVGARCADLIRKMARGANTLEFVAADIDPDAHTLVLCYGAAAAAAVEAVRRVRDRGSRVSCLTIHGLWPVPERAIRRAITHQVQRVLIPELNIGLYADELRKVLRAVKIEPLARFDGEPIPPEALEDRLLNWPCG